ncbi:MAG: hypothetical protein HFH36_12625 [Lachnospiraceae bacterium]|nr:hypothetical protein [Lachnospiraceae bacterium]
MIILMTILTLVLVYLVWQRWELSRFKVTKYQVSSHKLKEPVSVAVVADLHGFIYGEGNSRILREVADIAPQAILIPGDLLVSKYPHTYETAYEVLRELVKIAPVYYSYGNHESRLQEPECAGYPLFEQYLDKVRALGVHVLGTESRSISLGDNQVMLSSLELELDYYEKGFIAPMDGSYMQERLPLMNPGMFQILLAHNPAYAEQYAAWGADVTFCGHNHGGLVRIPGIGSLVSPQLTLFPKYDAGRFEIEGKHVIVSRGLGTHTFHVRVFNRAELLAVEFLPE